MGKLRWCFFFVLVCSGCAEKSGPSVHGDDGFAVGTQALTLAAAPPGLCEGGGADKECGPAGCVEAPVPPNPGGASGAPQSPGLPSSGGQAAPVGMSPPTGSAPVDTTPLPSSDFGGSGTAGSGFGDADTGNDSAPDPEPEMDPMVQEPECAELLPDGGLPPPDAGPVCGDAGVAMASAALIADDVPSCGMVDPGHASTLFMSADDSGSMAAPVIARRMIRSGRRVPLHVIRPWEFLNYYDFAFEPAAPGSVRIVPQLSSCPREDRLSLQVALQAEARAADDRAPITLTFVLDTSGSMGGVGNSSPIALEREAVLAMASQLRAGDIVSMVTWNTDQNVILAGHEVTGPDDPVVVSAASALQASGGTDLSAGLTQWYALAERFRGASRINRVVLISDGVANVGVTDEALIGRHADDEEGEAGIYLAGIGVGDGVNDTLMNTVTDVGRGTYVYLDSPEEARTMLGERFLQVVDLAVRNVRLEVTLPYHLVLEEFFGEVASTDASKVRPQHLGPNDAMLFLQVLRACDASLLRGDDRILLRATWETPFERESRMAVIDTTLNALAGNDDDLTKAAAIAAYTEALTGAGTLAADAEPGTREAILDEALAAVLAAQEAAQRSGSETGDPDLTEIADLLTRYRDNVR